MGEAVSFVPVPVEPDGSPAGGAGRAVGVAVRAVQRGAGGASRGVALGAPLGVVCRSVPDADDPAGGSPRGPRRRCDGVSGTLRRLDWAFAAFYRRCRAGQRPGYPRFRPRSRWDSLQWEDRNGWRLDPASRRLHLMGIGGLKVRWHRPLRGVPKAITVRREGRRWWVTIRCVDVPAEPLPATGREVGIDLGVQVLVATSDGALITNDRHAHRRHAAPRPGPTGPGHQTTTAPKHRRRAVERVAAAYRRVRNRRADTLHQLSRRLVNDHDLIVHEALTVRNLVRRPRPRPDGAGGYAQRGQSQGGVEPLYP